MKTVPRLGLLLLVLFLLLAACRSGSSTIPLPEQIALPDGFQPEGIAARDNFIFVGSIPSGAVFRADILSAAGEIIVQPPAGRAAIGIKVDSHDRIFVAGGPTGKAYVYDASTGEDLAIYTLTEAESFVNDIVLTTEAAWFTDSVNQVLYRVALPLDGSLGGQEAVTTLTLTGDLQFQEGFNLNGIAARADRLIAVQSNTGLLFTIDPATGVTTGIELGGQNLTNGDGLLLEDLTLFVVQNRLNQVAVVDLSPDLAVGTVRTTITNPSFDVPTTIAAASGGLYVVNARFGIEAPDTASYNVIRFARP